MLYEAYLTIPQDVGVVFPDRSQSNSQLASEEVALIQLAARRNQILHEKVKGFTCEERQAIRRGECALQQLLKAHRRLIRRLVGEYQIKGYNSNNSDLEQEATLAFFNAVITFDLSKGSQLSTWAYFQVRARLQRITRQTIHDAVAKTRVMRCQPVFSEPEPIWGQIHAVLSKLTEKQRQVVSLYLEGLGWTEIALKLQSKADAVRMLWKRAVQRLASSVGKTTRPHI